MTILYTCIYVYAHTYNCVWARVHAFAFVCARVNVYIYTCVCACVRVYKCIHLYTGRRIFTHDFPQESPVIYGYRVAMISRLLKIQGLFGRISSLL